MHGHITIDITVRSVKILEIFHFISTKVISAIYTIVNLLFN